MIPGRVICILTTMLFITFFPIFGSSEVGVGAGCSVSIPVADPVEFSVFQVPAPIAIWYDLHLTRVVDLRFETGYSRKGFKAIIPLTDNLTLIRGQSLHYLSTAPLLKAGTESKKGSVFAIFGPQFDFLMSKKTVLGDVGNIGNTSRVIAGLKAGLGFTIPVEQQRFGISLDAEKGIVHFGGNNDINYRIISLRLNTSFPPLPHHKQMPIPDTE